MPLNQASSPCWLRKWQRQPVTLSQPFAMLFSFHWVKPLCHRYWWRNELVLKSFAGQGGKLSSRLGFVVSSIVTSYQAARLLVASPWFFFAAFLAWKRTGKVNAAFGSAKSRFHCEVTIHIEKGSTASSVISIVSEIPQVYWPSMAHIPWNHYGRGSLPVLTPPQLPCFKLNAYSHFIFQLGGRAMQWIGRERVIRLPAPLDCQ